MITALRFSQARAIDNTFKELLAISGISDECVCKSSVIIMHMITYKVNQINKVETANNPYNTHIASEAIYALSLVVVS